RCSRLSALRSVPTRRSSDLPERFLRRGWDQKIADDRGIAIWLVQAQLDAVLFVAILELGDFFAANERAQVRRERVDGHAQIGGRSEEHTSELQSLRHLVCRL